MENEVEIWKDIAGYEGLYQVSNFGRVRSLDRMVNTRWNSKMLVKGKMLKASKNSTGYVRVNLLQKYINIHRLVAEAFIPNPDNLPCVNHKDENKTNNLIDNLEWCTQEYNLNYGTRIKRISKPIICVETGTIYQSATKAAEDINFKHIDSARKNINKAANNKIPVAYGYHWKFVD